MKFHRLMRAHVDEFVGASGGIGEHFLRYKALKKQLKEMQQLEPGRGDESEAAAPSSAAPSSAAPASMGGSGAGAPAADGRVCLQPGEAHFVDTLKEDVNGLNDYFIEREEDFVIRMEALVSQQAELTESDAERQAALRSSFIDLHGEMVLLLHWSMLNYAAVVKILKKHDKRSGVLLRTPFLANVLKQPFYSTEHITELVRDAEQRIEALRQGDAGVTTLGSAATAAKVERLRETEALLFRRTQAALEIWQEMADKASTPSTVLLPPAKRARTGEPGAAEAAPGAAHRQAPAADECGRAPGGDGSAIHQGHDQAPADAPPRAALAAEARSAAAAAVEGEAAQA